MDNTIRALRPAPAPAQSGTAGDRRVRPRRNRGHAWTRRMVRENHVTQDDLVWPVFIMEGKNTQAPVDAMPGVFRYSPDLLAREAETAAKLGIPAIALFPATPPEKKNPAGSEAFNASNLVCRAVRALKDAVPGLGVICDVALDPYTSHGHDGIMDASGRIANDETVEALCLQALTLAASGADFVAPSDMMDHRVGAIRDALDANGFAETGIISYAAKYASSFYGPFREAVGSGTALKGDKTTYQMDPANGDEALREVAADIAQGADMVMIKPGLPYLDIVRRVKDAFCVPTLAYHVSGEYAMLRAAAQNGWLDYDKAVMETLLSFKRAGCDAVFTYAARDAARLLKG